MFRNFFLIAFRNLIRNKVIILINVFGMGIAIACCIVAYFHWESDRHFDANHLHSASLYRVSSLREFDHETTKFGHAPLPLGPMIQANIPHVKKNMRQWWSYSNFKLADNIFPAELSYVDPDFFDMFTFEFMHGDGAAIRDPSKVVVSDEMAIRLFGVTDVTGRILTHVVGDKLVEREIGGVFKKQPSNTSFNSGSFVHFDNIYDEFAEMSEDDWRQRAVLFVQIDDPTKVETAQRQLQAYAKHNNQVREDFQISQFTLDPLIGMARRDQDTDTWTSTRAASPKVAVVTPIIMSGLILLIACFNFTNTAIAISSRRLKEIGIRKVMGSVRLQLIVQFMGETLLVCMTALLVGLALGETLIDSWNSMWDGMKLTSHYIDNPWFFVFIVTVLLLVCIVAGSYPALYISHFQPVSILKGKITLGGTNAFTRTLLGLQYAISLLAVIFAFAFFQNSRFQRDFNMGFDASSSIIAYVNSQHEFEAYRNAILQNKDVTAIAGAKHSIFSSGYKTTIGHESRQMEVNVIEVGDEYLKTLKFDLVDGRDFTKDSETDKKEAVIVSESVVRDLGWENPIGKQITATDTVRLYVVGVVKDVYTDGVWGEMEPMIIRYVGPELYKSIIVTGPVASLKDIDQFMEASWKKMFPNRLYNGRMMNDRTLESAMINNNIVKSFGFLGLVALFLSTTGLFTLVSLNIIRKTKEIGIRKILGASTPNIARLINAEFIAILSASSLGAAAASYFLVDAFMASLWKYYQPLTITVIFVAITLVILASMLAIGYKVFSAVRMNPVDSLRAE